ncbi:hypothetical protein ACWDE9_46745, partial [Streptomyces olivaceoviridis]
VEADPVAAVPAPSPGAAAALDEQRHPHASGVSLSDDKGEFLVLPPVSVMTRALPPCPTPRAGTPPPRCPAR